MEYQHKNSKEVKALVNIQNEFHKLRMEDDDFARAYARHEFHHYLKERYVECDTKGKEFASSKFIKEYNSYRERLMTYIKVNGIKVSGDLHKMTADELIGVIQEFENI